MHTTSCPTYVPRSGGGRSTRSRGRAATARRESSPGGHTTAWGTISTARPTQHPTIRVPSRIQVAEVRSTSRASSATAAPAKGSNRAHTRKPCAHLAVLLPHALQLLLQVGAALRADVNVVDVEGGPAGNRGLEEQGAVVVGRRGEGCNGVGTAGRQPHAARTRLGTPVLPISAVVG